MRRGKPKIPRECIGKKIIVEEIKKREKVKLKWKRKEQTIIFGFLNYLSFFPFNDQFSIEINELPDDNYA